MNQLQTPSIIKIAAVVWVPIIAIGSIYGGIYYLRSSQAKHNQAVYEQNYQNCQNAVAKENAAALAKGETGTGVETCQTLDEEIVHGTLGFPVFETNGVPYSAKN